MNQNKRRLNNSRKKQQNKRPQRLILFVASFLIMWMVGSGVYNIVNTHMVQTYKIESEYERRSLNGYGFIAAPSETIQSDLDGTLSQVVKQGDRVAKNHVVFKIAGSDDNKANISKDFFAPISGMVSYRIDGYEKLNGFDDVMGLDFRKIYEDELSAAADEPPSKVKKGDGVAKVIDNLKAVHLFMDCPISEQPVFSKVGDQVRVEFKKLEDQTTATVIALKKNEAKDTIFCELELQSVRDEILNHRVAETEIFIYKDAVLKLSAGTIVPGKEDYGVFVVNNGIVSWRPLTVLDHKGKTYYCKPLPAGTEIVLTPDRVDVGDII